MSEATRYPLSWPAGWKRTPGGVRQRARFGTGRDAGGAQVYGRRKLTLSEAIGRLHGELARLGAVNEILSTNVVTRLDGLPRSGQGEPQDPGAAVYFTLKGKPRCLACDRWNRVADNIAAIAAHVYAIRAVERYGVGTMDQAFAGYAQLPAATTEWWTVLGVEPNAGREEIDRAWKGLAFRHHPDHGGNADEMARVNAARDAALKQV